MAQKTAHCRPCYSAPSCFDHLPSAFLHDALIRALHPEREIVFRRPQYLSVIKRRQPHQLSYGQPHGGCVATPIPASPAETSCSFRSVSPWHPARQLYRDT